MLTAPLTITYDGLVKTLALISRSGQKSVYSGEEADGSRTYTVTVDHTIPARGQPGESHLVRADIEHYDANGVYVRTSSAWMVVKTLDGTQVTSASTDTVDFLVDFVSTAGVVGQILNGES